MLSCNIVNYLSKRCGVVVITTAKFHSTKHEIRFCLSEIPDGEELWQWSRLEVRLNSIHRSIIPQKQFIIVKRQSERYIIIIIITVSIAVPGESRVHYKGKRKSGKIFKIWKGKWRRSGYGKCDSYGCGCTQKHQKEAGWMVSKIKYRIDYSTITEDNAVRNS